MKRDSRRIEELERRARHVRAHIVRMITRAGSGHPGGSLSIADVVTALYFSRMRHDPRNPAWPDRDRFVMSKGHAAPCWYAALAESGYFDPAELESLRSLGSILQGHPDMRLTPGVDMSTGSLGQGLSAAVGMALAGKLDGKTYRVYAVVGDGESQEGQVWEAAMSAAHYRLDNLCAVLDFNGLQIDGRIQDVMNPEPFDRKWSSFGWAVREIDGHDMGEILDALEWARGTKRKPSMIIARTVKGKGVSFMEGVVDFHGKAPTPEEGETALRELGL